MISAPVVVSLLASRIVSTMFALITALAVPDDVERLHATSPQDLTYAQAAEHLRCAKVAEQVTGEDHATLLAIAWHETHFTPGYAQPEPADSVTGAARESCGVMTPEPLPAPCVPATLVQQYIAGARHLAVWRARRGTRALDAYAGGNWLATGCQVGPVLKNGRDLCQFARDMRALADRIR